MSILMHGCVQRHRARMKIDVLRFYGCRHALLLHHRDIATGHWFDQQMMHPPLGVHFVLLVPPLFMVVGCSIESWGFLPPMATLISKRIVVQLNIPALIT